MPTVKSIQIAGWLSDREVAKGKTAVWTGSEIWETCEVDGPYWADEEIEEQLKAAQAYTDRAVAENNWAITPKAIVDVFEYEEEPQD